MVNKPQPNDLAIKALPIARKILLSCNELTKISEDNVEEFIPLAREIAISTEQLSDFIHQQVNLINDKLILKGVHKKDSREEDIQLLVNDVLIQSITELQAHVLELVKATRSAIQNPCSYSSFERVSNCSEQIVTTIDNLNTAIELIQIFSNSSEHTYNRNLKQKNRCKVILESASEFAADVQNLMDTIPNSTPVFSIHVSVSNAMNQNNNLNNASVVQSKVQKNAEILLQSCNNFIRTCRNELLQDIGMIKEIPQLFDDVIETTNSVIFFANLITSSFFSKVKKKK